ncbi:transposase [Kitasatospora cineracea]|uniref:transposase n=1 Tax=Kitasatospora cineracea TaxID=88074 RepID=UPI003F4D459A
MERMPYSTDLSDGQWALIEPLVTAWKQQRVSRSATGDPGSCDLREVVNALLHQNRTGCQWRLLPHDLPTWSVVFYYFTLWQQDGLDQRIQEIPRCQVTKVYALHPDPSGAYVEAVRAVEDVANPLYASSPRATLGEVIREFEHRGGNYSMVILDNNAAPATTVTVLSLVKLLWHGHRDRHPGGQTSAPITQEAAQAAVHIAALLVQLLSTSAVVKNPWPRRQATPSTPWPATAQQDPARTVPPEEPALRSGIAAL